MVGVVTELQCHVIGVALVRGGFIDHQAEHVLPVVVIVVVELALYVQVVLSGRPHLGDVDGVVTDAVCFLGGHVVDVLGEDVFNVAYLGVVFVAGQLFGQLVKVDKGALSVFGFIVAHLAAVGRVELAPFVQQEVVVVFVQCLYSAHAQQRILKRTGSVCDGFYTGKRRKRIFRHDGNAG